MFLRKEGEGNMRKINIPNQLIEGVSLNVTVNIRSVFLKMPLEEVTQFRHIFTDGSFIEDPDVECIPGQRGPACFTRFTFAILYNDPVNGELEITLWFPKDELVDIDLNSQLEFLKMLDFGQQLIEALQDKN